MRGMTIDERVTRYLRVSLWARRHYGWRDAAGEHCYPITERGGAPSVCVRIEQAAWRRYMGV